MRATFDAADTLGHSFFETWADLQTDQALVGVDYFRAERRRGVLSHRLEIMNHELQVYGHHDKHSV
ncbi:hypothetical protein D3C71_2083160 [compost metagenome]